MEACLELICSLGQLSAGQTIASQNNQAQEQSASQNNRPILQFVTTKLFLPNSYRNHTERGTGSSTLEPKASPGRVERIDREGGAGKGTISKLLEGTARAARIAETVAALYAEGIALPDVRRALASDPKLGGSPSLYLGSADPIYYRLAGLAAPLVLPARAKATVANGAPSAALATALRKRRDSGVRWETVAASTEAILDRRVSVSEAKRLYEKAKGDLRLSYAGKGTRVGAPGTYDESAAAPVE